MNMIDVMKRLAELDAVNPNVQTEAISPNYRWNSNQVQGHQDADGEELPFDAPRSSDMGVGNRNRQSKNAVAFNKHMQQPSETTVHINGKSWKTFPSRDEANRVATNLQRKYPDKKVEVVSSQQQPEGKVKEASNYSWPGNRGDEWRGVQRSGWRDAVGEEDPAAYVHINGKPWKEFPSRNEAERAAYNIQKKYPGKKVEVVGGEISVREGKVKELADDLKNLSSEEFEKAHNMTKAEARKGLSEGIADIRRLAGMSPLAECEMGGMGSMGAMPAMPASISITAANGPELSGMLKDIMSLAGLNKVEPAHLNIEPPALMSPPSHDDAAASPDGMLMRGMMDKLNPEMGDDDMGDEEEDEGIMSGLAGGAIGAALGGPAGAAAGYGAGSKVGDDLSSDDEEEDEDTEETYDNTPADPRKKPEFDANKYAHQANQPGQGDRMDGTAPRAHPGMKKTMEQIEQSLFDEYQSFINESEWTAEKPATKFSAADKKKSDALKKSSGKTNADALKKNSDAFAKKKAD